MNYSHPCIALSQIDTADRSFQITTSDQSHALAEAIASAGLINKPILRKRGQAYIILSGFSRIAACRLLGWEQIPARVPEPEIPFEACAKIAIIENSFQRKLNLVELARAATLLQKALGDPGRVVQSACTLGLSINAELLGKLEKVQRMSDALQAGLIDGTLALPVALRISAIFGAADAELIAELFRDLDLSLNRQRELVDWIEAIAGRDGMSVTELLAEEPLARWRQDPTMDRRQRANRIRDHLRRRRYPTICFYEARWRELVREIKLGQGMRLEPPAHFEGQNFSLRMDFKNAGELAQARGELEKLIHSPLLAELLAFPQA